MLLFKTPLAFFLLLPFAAFSRKSEGEENPQNGFIYLFAPFLTWLIIFSTLCDLQLGIRYILPAFTFLIVYAGKAIRGVFSPKRAMGTGFLIGWYILSSLSYVPHFMSYFNETIGARMNAYKYMADSNLDWEDNDYWIQNFRAQHPELAAKLTDAKNPESGFLIVGANDFTGVMDEAKTEWLRRFKPLREIAYSHYLFYIDPEKLKDVLQNPNS